MTRLVWDLFLHIFFGTLMFCFIGAAAVGLHVLVSWAEGMGLPPLVVPVFGVFEYILFAIDFLLFLVFLVSVSWKFAKDARRLATGDDQE
jgi:hypothetical protein